MKKCFCTSKAAIPAKTVSQAVIENGMVFVSGQISICPETKEIKRGNIKFQTKMALTNLKIIVEEAGSSLENILMCNVYISSMNLFEEMDEIYGEFFNNNPPARATVAVKELYDGLDVEITAIALLNER